MAGNQVAVGQLYPSNDQEDVPVEPKAADDMLISGSHLDSEGDCISEIDQAKKIHEEFDSSSISQSVVDFITQSSVVNVGLHPAQAEILKTQISEFLEEKYPEFESIKQLKEQARTTNLSASVKYKDSGLSVGQYLREYFADQIHEGFLPLTEIDDPQLRTRASKSKWRDQFPKDLNSICLTQSELLNRARTNFAKILGFTDSSNSSYAKIAQSVLPERKL